MKAVKIVVFGKVQGVYFRANTKKEAKKYSINGFVKNENNGSVYIEAIGESDNLAAFIKWCRKGPILAYVKHVELEDIPFKHFSTFQIRYD